MKLKETIKELSDHLTIGGFTRDSLEWQSINNLLDVNQKKAMSELLRLFSNYNQFFERAFTKIPYPRRDEVQRSFRILKEQLLNDIAEQID